MKTSIVCLAIITISLIFTVHTYAEIDFSTARGIWLLDEGEATLSTIVLETKITVNFRAENGLTDKMDLP